jgi:uncharacterized integral membrane protein
MFLSVLFAVLVGGWGLLFCLSNPAAVTLDFVLFRLPAAPVGAWVLGAFVSGGIGGLLASSLALLRGRRM